jgi:ubiquinone biosynthesis monooxygenase Coq7
MPKPQFKNKDELIEEIIRVDHAGEYGAVEIYSGQLQKIKDQKTKALIQEMYNGEKIHLNYFENQIKIRNVRPTIMLPLWKILGKTFGGITSRGGNKLAMALTESVETVIDKHYEEQLKYLENVENETDLAFHIDKFRKEELEHRSIAIETGSQTIPLYYPFNTIVKTLCKLAISLSKRV